MNPSADKILNPDKTPVYIIKSDGGSVPFDEEKLRNSLLRAGAAPATVGFIIREIEHELHDGITTRKIYRKAFELLKKDSRSNAARYKLKRAIMELGPTGYPFESYVSEVLKDQGYQVQVGVMEQGKCIQHEVDVIGERKGTRIATECKFGNSKDKKIDIKVALYIHSRFQDLKNQWENAPEHRGKKFEGWIVTNGFFTEDAITYGNCVGLHLISWNYPQRGSLKDLIDVCHLHPVTSLTTLKKGEIRMIMDAGVVLCRDLLLRNDLIEAISLSHSRRKKLRNEIEGLCG